MFYEKSHFLYSGSYFFFLLDLTAAVRTVCNNPQNPGQFSDLQTAIDASAVGDTVYVHPSNVDYPSVVLRKRINLFGAGFDTRTYQYVGHTRIGGINIGELSSFITSAGSNIIGINVRGGIYMHNGNVDSINNVRIERCFMWNLGINGDNWRIRNCVVTDGVTYYGSNHIFENNIFSSFSLPISSGFTSTNVIFRNNIFWFHNPPINTRDATYVNNIFTSTQFGPLLTHNCNGCINNNFVNNLFHEIQGSIPPALNTGSNNIVNQNPPVFVNTPALTTILDRDSIILYDFRLRSTSPGRNYGTDGTDLGIYGGVFPWLNPAGLPWLPQVIQLDISNVTIPVGGTLNVTSRGVKRN